MRLRTPLLLLLVIAMLLVGCGGGGKGTTTTNSATPVPTSAITPVPQKPGTTKITFWYGLGGINGDALRKLINRYNESQDKYYVESVFQASYDDTLSKFNASLSGNQLPNVVQIYDIGSQRMIDTKQIIPVQDLIQRDNLQSLVDDLEPAIRNYYTINGKLYSMPFNSSTMVMYYDKNAFKEAGLDANKKIWTYSELLEAAKKLTKKDGSGKVSRAGVGLYDYSWFFEQELAAHDTLAATPNNGRTERATKFTFNNSVGVKWLEWQKQLLDNNTATYFGTNGPPATTAFLNGQTAITFESIASLRNILSTNEKNGGKLDVGIAYVPRLDGQTGGRTAIGGASLWLTNKGTKEQQEGGWDFMKFLAQPEIQAIWSSSTGYMPIRLSAYDQQEMKDTLKKYPQFQVGVEQIRSGQTNYNNAGCVAGNMISVRNYIQQATDDFLTGHADSAQKALDSAVQKANDSLEEYNLANQ